MVKENKKYRTSLLEDNIIYVELISKIKDIEKFLISYDRFCSKKLDVLDWMDIMDESIEGTDITEEELDYIIDVLKKKLLERKYSIADILREINIINEKGLSDKKKEEKLKSIIVKYSYSGYNYNYKNPRKIVPEDLKEYGNRIWIKSIVTNPVGGKR